MALQWTSALSVGVPELDEQHAELFEHVDRLHGAILKRDRAEAGRMIAFLQEYVRFHFGAEEALMGSLAYPALPSHQKEHAKFKAEVEQLASELDQRGPSAQLVHRLEREVTGWLTNHIYTTDLAFGLFVRKGRGLTVS